jgi:hypothetical protein
MAKNFLYVFTSELAQKLEEEGLKLHNHSTQGKEHWVFLLDVENLPKIVFTFSAGNDYVVSNKMFF